MDNLQEFFMSLIKAAPLMGAFILALAYIPRIIKLWKF